MRIFGWISPAATLLLLFAGPLMADELRASLIRGSVQLGGQLVVVVQAAGRALPETARCDVSVPEPYSRHLSVVDHSCNNMTMNQGITPILDELGKALPSGSIPYVISATAPDGSDLGQAQGELPYNNQFSELEILIRDVRNPVSPGQSFSASVLGAGQPIDGSLLCRWNTYGPVKFEATAPNGCVGTLTALPPDGRDADMDVEIVNLVDMHAVGYATARMLVR